MKRLCIGLALALFSSCSLAQPLDVAWSTIDNGGGRSSGGVFEVTGTIGQSDAASRSIGGRYGVVGGFWAASADRSCPADFNEDRFVDDTDFVLFTQQYEIFECADPIMGDGCSADLSRDGFVDDIDFVLFTQAYEQFTCP